MNRPAVFYDELDERLRGGGRNDYVGMSAIDGLVTAVVAGPATVAPAVWLPNVFGGTMPQTKPGSLEERLVKRVISAGARMSSGDKPLAPWFEVYARVA